MSENYIVINGKRIELTEEQLKTLGITTKKTRKNPFENPEDGEYYYFIDECDVDNHLYYKEDDCDYEYLRDAANYFNDKQFAEQVALHQLLYRKLLKFAYDNGFEDTAECGYHNRHYTVYYDKESNCFCIDDRYVSKYFGVYFATQEGAECAIEEVVEPFMKEHPDFVW